MNLAPKGFKDHPYSYHQELILVIENVTNLGLGISRDNGWVVQIAFVLPGEKVRARIFRNHKSTRMLTALKFWKNHPTGWIPIAPCLELAAVANINR